VSRLFYFLLCLVIILGLFPNYKPIQEKEYFILKNGCLIYSIEYQHALTAKNILKESEVWAKIILYKLQGEKTGHAITLYIYKNSTYVYDPAFASYRLSQFPIYNPYKIVQLMHPMSKILWVEYAEAVMFYNP